METHHQDFQRALAELEVSLDTIDSGPYRTATAVKESPVAIAHYFERARDALTALILDDYAQTLHSGPSPYDQNDFEAGREDPDVALETYRNNFLLDYDSRIGQLFDRIGRAGLPLGGAMEYQQELEPQLRYVEASLGYS